MGAPEDAVGLMASVPITQPELDSLNVAQSRNQNKENLGKLDGISGLMAKLHLNPATGLTQSQVDLMRSSFGNNSFPASPMATFLELFIASFGDTTLLILLAAAAVSLVIGIIQHPDTGWIEGTAIFIAVFLVAIITAGNDYSKELQFRSLEASAQNDERASVYRNSIIERINPIDIVVGDILVLQAGDSIPADAIVMDNSVCKANESALTGEPEDVKKGLTSDPFLLSSCLITECDETRAIVTGIGMNSQWGKIKANLVTEAVNTPLQDKLEKMTELIGYVGMACAVLTFIAMIINIWARGDGNPSSATIVDGIIGAFILAVTIVVVAIPEGLPLAVTIALAYSTKKMYQDQNFIRVLAACETMGNATNICSDKTGTLTENRMTVVEGWFGNVIYTQDNFESETASSTPTPASSSLTTNVRRLIAVNSCVNRVAYMVYKDQEGNTLDKPVIVGNKTEGALLLMSKTWGFEEEKLKTAVYDENNGDKVFSFNSGKKRSTAVVHNSDGSVTLYCKGASEWVMKDCTTFLDSDGSIQTMTPQKRAQIEQHIEAMANRALRTLCLAHRTFAKKSQLPADWMENPPDHADMTCDCIVGIIDPLRSDVKEAVATAQRAGVTVRMVTGDNISTASAIARQCGILLEGGQAVEGPNFRDMTPKAVDDIIPTLQVVARSSPQDKYLLVTRLNGYAIPENEAEWNEKHADIVATGATWEKDRDRVLPGYMEEWKLTRPDGGEVVGVTGDGTNDAPALKAADVGLSMGITGTKVAQAASDIVILDDKFSSIVKAIMWGRCVYDNIRKFLQFQLTVNVVALLLVFIAACNNSEEPLNAVQMLWVNLVMDTMGALALATEPPTMELLNRRPYKRSAPLLSRPMLRNITVQSIFQLVLLLVLLFKGADMFNVTEGVGCSDFSTSTSNTLMWDVSSGQQVQVSAGGNTVTCSSFYSYCDSGDRGDSCVDATHELNSIPFQFNNLDDYTSTCLDCQQNSYLHGTIIFNAFIFCQFFNEYTSRHIFDEWNPFKDLMNNYVFIIVSIVTLLCQIMLVEVGGEFTKTSPLDLNQWLITIALGFIGVPLGILMRFIPMPDDPNDFFDSNHSTDRFSAGGYLLDESSIQLMKSTKSPMNEDK